MTIRIEAGIVLVTLRAAGTTLPMRWTSENAASVFTLAADYWKGRADIQFTNRAITSATDEMPADVKQDRVDDAGFHFLASVHRAARGVQIILVDRVSRGDLGGVSRAQTRVCLVPYFENAAAAGRYLSHELGHLLGLPHLDMAPLRLPGRERDLARMIGNLMVEGTIVPNPALTPAQAAVARASTLATQFALQ